jgi:integrase
MASLKRISRSPYWVACFRKANGKATCRSTKVEATERNYQQAYKIAVAFEEAYRKSQIIGHAGQVLAEIAEEVNQGSARMGCLAISEAWLDNAARTMAAGTVAAYQTATRRWKDWLLSTGLEKSHIGQLSRQNVIEWRNHCADNWGASAANRGVQVVKQILDSAVFDGAVMRNVANKIDKVTEQNDFEREQYSAEDLAKLWATTVDRIEWRTMLMLGLYTGQRLVDLATLRWSGIDLDAGEIRITTQKTKRKHVCLIHPALSSWLSDIRPRHALADDLVSPSLEGRHGTTLSKLFGEILDDSGVDFRTVVTNGRARRTKTFHSLRHTLPSMLAKSGASAKVIQDIVGHDSRASTARYTHTEREQITTALEKLSDPFK